MLTADITCRQCGYNLRGLQETGDCPECGLRIALSLSKSVLRFSNPKWVKRLRHGALLTGVGWLGVLNVPALILLAASFASAKPLRVWLMFALIAFMLFAGILFTGGLLMAIRPPAWERQPTDKHCKFFIVLSTLMMIFIACRILWASLAGAFAFPSLAYNLLLTGGIITASALEYFRMRIVVSLCELIPDEPLASEAHRRGRSLWVSLAVLSLGSALQTVRTLLGVNLWMAGSRNAIVNVIGTTYLVCSLVIFVAAILYGTFLIGFSRRLTEEAGLAAKNWSAPKELSEVEQDLAP